MNIDIDHLRSDHSPTAIRRIRTLLIGKPSSTEAVLKAGILPILGEILAQSESEDIRVEVSHLVSSTANEGPSYVVPILNSNVPALLLQRLTHPSRDALAILKCLNAIASALPTEEEGEWAEDNTLADLLYSEPFVKCFVDGIGSPCNTLTSSQTCDLTISLLCKTCTNEEQKSILAEHGILQILAQRLASFVVADGLVAPSLEAIDFPDSASSSLPDPAPANAHLSPILEAVALLLENSEQRAEIFFSNATLEAVFPHATDMFTPSSVRQTPWGGGSASARIQSRHAIDTLLPIMPTKPRAGSSSNINFPPLGAAPLQRRRSSFHPNPPQSPSATFATEDLPAEEEKGIIPYLLIIARESRGKRRLVACKLLAVLQDLELVPKSRSRSFAPLLVPILVRMLDVEEPAARDGAANIGSYMSDGSYYTKAAPAVLGMLIMDDLDFQKIAVEARAIPKLSSSLKRSFDAIPNRKKIPWKPYKESAMELENLPSDCTLGHFGPSDVLRRDMKYREGILQALAAIAPFNDEYRQQICDQGILPHILQSMEPYDIRRGKTELHETVGNPASTILAACGCVRALTRSVKALRTKLVDADVAKSIISLISNRDPEVRIAATQVLTNLAMDFSPMKESFRDSYVVERLCLQAHSANAHLRYESLWALKQLAVNASHELKMKIVEELDCGWIRELISTDPKDIKPGEVIGLGTSNIGHEDVEMSEDQDSADLDDTNPQPRGSEWFSQHTAEQDYSIQEQIFDLVRNLFCGDNASDMIDLMLKEIGQHEFFEILRKRLTSRRDYGATRKFNVDSPPRFGLIFRVLYVVIHIAACSQHWRKVITGETLLLKVILGFSNHTEREVRAQICWLAINLTFEDDSSDKYSCQQRARELNKLGFREKIQKLESDADLDVRERAKTAMHLFSSLLDPK